MKRFITSLVAAGVLGALLTGKAGAQPPVARPSSALRDALFNNKAKSERRPDFDLLVLLTIDKFDITGYGRRSNLEAVIKSHATQPLVATYTFSMWDGKSWITLDESKTVTVPAKQSVPVTQRFRREADTNWVRLVVRNTAGRIYQAKQLKLPPMN